MSHLLVLASEFPPGPGGIGTHACQIAAGMRRRGWQVKVLTVQDYASEEEIADFNQKQDFQIERWLRPRNRVWDAWGRWQQFQKTIDGWHPDVLLVSGDRQVWMAAAARHGIPWCAVWHGSIPHHALEKKLIRWSFGQPDLTIAVSQYSKDQLLKLGSRPRCWEVIHNGADQQAYFPDPDSAARLRKELGLEEALILLTVGHVTERKGQDIVIRALPQMLKSLPNVHYLIAGLPALRATLEKLACDLGVGQHVHFLGRLSPALLQAAYNACDVFVLTSRHSTDGQFEGYGIVVIEAALCAKPAVVANNSGLVEAVREGQTGLVVPENDPDATAAALQRLLQDQGLRRQMGAQARRRALAEQTWEACMDRYQQALNQLAPAGEGRVS